MFVMFFEIVALVLIAATLVGIFFGKFAKAGWDREVPEIPRLPRLWRDD